MYEHPYFHYSRFEHEELARRAERHRFIAEHADQIVARPQGRIGRMLGRIGIVIGPVGHRTARRQTPCDPAVAR